VLTRPPQRPPGKAGDPTRKARQKLGRDRRRRGMIVLKIEAREFPLADALLNAGRLNEAACLDRKKVEAEAGRILQDFVDRWSK
jgi:hypothetical protein